MAEQKSEKKFKVEKFRTRKTKGVDDLVDVNFTTKTNSTMDADETKNLRQKKSENNSSLDSEKKMFFFLENGTGKFT